MSNASQLRDSTQIVLPAETLDSLEPQLDEAFTVTITSAGEDRRRIIASPVEIQAVREFLTRRGISVR